MMKRRFAAIAVFCAALVGTFGGGIAPSLAAEAQSSEHAPSGEAASAVAYLRKSPIETNAPSGEAMASALAYLRKSPIAASILQKVLSNPNVFVRDGKGGSADEFLLCETTDGEKCGIIVWDKTLAVSYPESGAIQSSALQFMHEAIHAYDYLANPIEYDKRRSTRNLLYDDEEERFAISIERQIADELGEYQRETHHGSTIVVHDVTFHRTL